MPFIWLTFTSVVTLDAAPRAAMQTYVIDLPQHTLRFSLPTEIAREVSPQQVEASFSPTDASFRRVGFRQIAGHMHDFKGPFWKGALGSLKFHVMIQKRYEEYRDEIASIDGLARYLQLWNKKVLSNDPIRSSDRSMLNVARAIRREWTTFDDPSCREPRQLEIYSLPLDQEMYLDLGFHMMMWGPGRGSESRWKPKAESLRESIKATIVLERKPQ